MTKQELINSLQHNIASVDKTISDVNKKVTIISDFLEKIEGNKGITAITEMSNYDLLVISALLSSPELSVKDIKQVISPLKKMLTNINDEQVSQVLQKMLTSNFIEIFCQDDSMTLYHILFLFGKAFNNKVADDTFKNFMLFITIKMRIISDLESINSEREKKQPELLNSFLEDCINKHIINGLNDIFFSEGKPFSQVIVNIRRILNDYKVMLQSFNNPKTDSINNQRELLDLLEKDNDPQLLTYDFNKLIGLDPSFVNAILDIIESLQNKEYDAIKKQILEHISNGCELNESNLNQIDTILKEFYDRGFPISATLNQGLIQVLLTADYNKVINILHLWDNGTIDASFIQNNLGIFISKDDKQKLNKDDAQSILKPLYETFVTNLGIFKKQGIDFNSPVQFNLEMLLVDNTNVMTNCNMLKWYQSLGIANGQLLIDSDGYDIIDYFIENEYDPRIINAINLRGIKSDYIIKRIELAMFVSFNGMSSESIKGAIEQTDGINISGSIGDYIPDETLRYKPSIAYYHYSRIIKENERVVISDTVNNLDVIQALDNTYGNGLLYDIAGIKISKIKVLRILTLFEKLHILDKYLDGEGEIILAAALSYNTYLEPDKFMLLVDDIKNNSRIQQAMHGKRRD